jgi:hypothetical protein
MLKAVTGKFSVFRNMTPGFGVLLFTNDRNRFVELVANTRSYHNKGASV